MKKKIEKKGKKKTNNFPQNTSYKTANLVIGTLLKQVQLSWSEMVCSSCSVRANCRVNNVKTFYDSDSDNDEKRTRQTKGNK